MQPLLQNSLPNNAFCDRVTHNVSYPLPQDGWNARKSALEKGGDQINTRQILWLVGPALLLVGGLLSCSEKRTMTEFPSDSVLLTPATGFGEPSLALPVARRITGDGPSLMDLFDDPRVQALNICMQDNFGFDWTLSVSLRERSVTGTVMTIGCGTWDVIKISGVRTLRAVNPPPIEDGCAEWFEYHIEWLDLGSKTIGGSWVSSAGWSGTWSATFWRC